MFSYDQYKAAADFLGCEPELIESVVEKETGGKSSIFNSGGKNQLKILFERHVFWRELVRRGIDPRELLKRDPSLADIISQQPFEKYGAFALQYERRNRAANINQDAALAACSYGAMQIMGGNYEEAGYASVQDFVSAMETDSASHLVAFCRFCKQTGAAACLAARDIEGFARIYNGPSYYKRGYHIDLSRIYQRILARNLPKHESMIKAVATSQTVQRAAAVVATGVTPIAAGGVGSVDLSMVMSQLSTMTTQGGDIVNQISALHEKAAAIAPFLSFMPALAVSWTLLLLVIFAAVVRRYLLDRGYLRS